MISIGKLGKIGNIKNGGNNSQPIYEAWWEEFGVRGGYITSSNINAYIDTHYTLQYDRGTTEIGVSVENIDNSTSIYGFIERSGDISNRIAIGSTGSGLFVGAGNTIYLTTPTIQNKKYDIIWNRKTNITFLDGVENITPPTKTDGNTYPAYLFSRNDNGKPDAAGRYNLIGSVYYLREILDDIIQFSYIPIQVTKSFTDLRGVTHPVGNWIMVNELVSLDVPTHYGTFSGVLLDDIFEELLYVEMDGRQYIDTGVIGDETTEFGMEFALTQLSQQKIGGSRTSASIGNITFSYPTNSSNNYFNIDFQNNVNNRVATDTPFEIGKFYVAISSPTQMSLDDYIKPVINVTHFNTPTTLRVGDGYGLTYATSMMSGKVSRYWIKKSTDIIQICKPVKLLLPYGEYLAGDVGVLNTIDKTFRKSATNIPLIAGPIKLAGDFNDDFNIDFY